MKKSDLSSALFRLGCYSPDCELAESADVKYWVDPVASSLGADEFVKFSLELINGLNLGQVKICEFRILTASLLF